MMEEMYVQATLRELHQRESERLAAFRRELKRGNSRDTLPGGVVARVLSGLRLRSRPAMASSAAVRPAADPEPWIDGASGLAALRLRDVPLVAAPFLDCGSSVLEALQVFQRSRAPGLLTTCSGRPAVVTRLDIDLVMPSPATTLARYEMPGLLERVKVADAVRGSAPVLGMEDRLPKAVAMMQAWDWRPLVVTDGHRPQGLLTVGSLLTALARATR